MSDIREENVHNRECRKDSNAKVVSTYGVCAVLCAGAGYIYTLFGHGVSSVYMSLMFLVPLIGGMLVFAVLKYLFKIHQMDRMMYNLYNSAIAALTAGICLKGIYQIAGSDSRNYLLFFIAAVVCFCIAVIRFGYIRMIAK